MDLNLISIIYLFFRLAPFIIVCFFTLNSVINQDLRGLMYLCGLLLLLFFVFISPNTWILLILNLILLIRVGIAVPDFNLFQPFEYVYSAFSKTITSLLTNYLLLMVSIILAGLIIGSYVLHIYELSAINLLNNKSGVKQEGECGSWLNLPCYLKSLINIITVGFEETKDESDGYCMEFSINGSEIKKPLAASIYGFTFGYLFFFINKYNLLSSNIPIITLFPAFAVGDLAFQKFHHCRPGLATNLLAIFLGFVWGINWGDVIASMKNASLQYFVGGDQPVCSVPTSQKFVCNVYKNGQLIATQTNGSSVPPSSSSDSSSSKKSS